MESWSAGASKVSTYLLNSESVTLIERRKPNKELR